MATHYNSSEYHLRYFHDHIDGNGMAVKLEIYKRGERSYPIVIGDMTSLLLNIQGAQGDADSPIVKTSLTFSMVDSYDKGLTDDEGVITKHGEWSEFFTPDSTLYLVKLLTKAADADAYTERWCGYVTPDSWEESLDYYGDVSITARDNIGHLADFEFDAAGDELGLISIRDILSMAFDKIALPMESAILSTTEGDCNQLSQDGISIYDMLINVEAFKGKSWYKAVEEVLSSYGLVMRYVDDNTVAIDTVRNISLVGKTSYSDVERKEVEFLNGMRRKIPAYKKVISDLQYKINDVAEYTASKNSRFAPDAAALTAPYKIRCEYGSSYTERTGTSVFDMVLSHTKEGMTGYGMTMNHKAGNRYIDESGLRAGADPETVVFAGINLTDTTNRYIRYEFGNVNSLDCIVRMKFCDRMFQMDTHPGEAPNIGTMPGGYLTGFKYSLIYRNPDGAAIYYDAVSRYWSSTQVENTYTTSELYTDTWEVDLAKAGSKSLITGGGGNLYILINSFQAKVDGPNMYRTGEGGIYIAIKGFELEVSGSSNLESDKVTTINDDRMNIVGEAQPELGVVSRDVNWQSVKNYLNVLYKKINGIVSMVGYRFVWSDSDGAVPMGAYPGIEVDGDVDTFPLPMLIHLQKLLWRGDTTTIIEGDCVISDRTPIGTYCLYEYKGVPFYLIAGNIDLVHARINGAIFVEASNAIPRDIKMLVSEDGRYVFTEDGELVNVISRFK